MTPPSFERGSVAGLPRSLLRLEGAALLAAALFAYWRLSGDWRWLALFFFAPDLTFIAYLAGPRAGAIAYNAVHTILAPLFVAGAGLTTGEAWMIQLALVHLAHIGFDRSLGYGLKYQTGFADTHLGRIGR